MEQFSLHCHSSCTGGLQRRDCELLFTLEYNGLRLGTASIEVRSCACPARDRKSMEDRVQVGRCLR